MLKADSGTSLGKNGTKLGPYRATRLWNDVIRTFRAGMPIGRHRRQLRIHEDCFVATEAVNWLHSHLMRDPNFGSEVTRSQTMQLLQKFMKAKVFADVRGSKYNKEEFEDNGKLYRFMQTSPLKAVRTPLAVRNNGNTDQEKRPIVRPAKIDYEKLKPVTCIPEEGLPKCEVVVPKMLTVDEIEQEYKNLTLIGIKKLLGLDSLVDILDNDWASGKNVMHNMNYVAKSGYVTNIDKKDQLPTWVLSAMRCLANWPNRVDENIPDYPGFEKDVFRVVQDYFQGLREPLLTFAMYDLITNVLVKVEATCKQPPPQYMRRSSTTSNLGSVGNLPMFASAENLLMNMTVNNYEPTHIPTNGKCKLSPIYAEWDRVMYGSDSRSSMRPSSTESGVSVGYSRSGSNMHGSARSLHSSQRNNDTYTVYQPRQLSTDHGYYSSFNSVSQRTNQTPSYEYENNNKPKYTIVRLDSRGNLLDTGNDEANRSNLSNRSNLNQSQKFASMQDINEGAPNSNLAQANKYYSTNDLSSAQQFLDSSLRNKSGNNGSSRSVVTEQYTSRSAFTDQYTSGSLLTVSHDDHSYHKTANRSLPQYVSPPSYYSDHQPVISGAFRRQTSSSSTASYKTAPSQNNSSGLTSYTSARSTVNVSEGGTNRNLSRSGRSASSSNISSTPIRRDQGSSLNRYVSSASLFAADIEPKVENALQLCCLLLPPGNRRKLHLLLRLLNKMASNTHLEGLDDTMSVRSLVLQTFSRAILRCQEEADLDELLALRLVTFMVDHYEEIMKVPENLKTQIEDKLVYLRRAKVTQHEYEVQGMSASQMAITNLLDTVVKDQKMSQKEKKKKLKIFQKTYPEIYNKKFPTSQSEAAIYKPKIKQPLLARPLQKLRTLRL